MVPLQQNKRERERESKSQITGMSVRIPMQVTALCMNPVSLSDSSSGASLTEIMQCRMHVLNSMTFNSF